MRLDSVESVYADQLADLRSAESQLIEALPKMAAAASDEKLKQAFQEHLEQTEQHLERLNRIIGSFPTAVASESCEAMQGLIKEGEKIITAEGPGAVKDVALIAAAQRVEHYEIAAYGTARTLADQLGASEARQLLNDTLHEESETDEQLTKLATGGLIGTGINQRAES